MAKASKLALLYKKSNLLGIFSSLVSPWPHRSCWARRRRSFELDEPVVVTPVGVPDDVVEDHETLELVLEVSGRVLVQRLRLEPPEVELRVFVVFDENLEGPDLK